jgi:hypothetical protein
MGRLGFGMRGDSRRPFVALPLEKGVRGKRTLVERV